MCYRFTRSTPAQDIAEYFDTEEIPTAPPRYNIALSQPILSLRPTERGNQWVELKWGFVPHWSKEAKPRPYGNAKSETVGSKPFFRDAFKKRRCLVPADGFYEWEDVDGKKMPWLFRLSDGGLFAFAGIWDIWTDSAGKSIETCAILTTTANDLLTRIHDRMPVMLTKENMSRWMDVGELPDATCSELFSPLAANRMKGVRVDTKMNNPRYEAADAIQPIAS